MVLARRMWPRVGSYSLPFVCEHLDLAFDSHHDALADAHACAKIAQRLLTDNSATTFAELAARLGIRMGRLGTEPISFTGTLSTFARRDAIAAVAERGASYHQNPKKGHRLPGVRNPRPVASTSRSSRKSSSCTAVRDCARQDRHCRSCVPSEPQCPEREIQPRGFTTRSRLSRSGMFG
jgi:hypothetical protein